MDIQGTCKGAELDKRFYMPGIVLTDTCPKCAAPWRMDLANNYIRQYPIAGEPITVNAYCQECDQEWVAGEVVIEVTLRSSSGPTAEGPQPPSKPSGG